MNVAIDLVYLWVDGNDHQWLAKKECFLDESIEKKTLVGRYEYNDELKYSLRSVEKHMPWIRKIFIITDNQIPDFLDINHPKIEIVDHSEIIPKEILPMFNSSVIDYFVHNITGLSEQFLFANDDCFVNMDLSPDFFFKDNLPIIRMIPSFKFLMKIQWKKFLNKPLGNYFLGILKVLKMIRSKYKKYYFIRPHHNIDAYLKSDYKKTTEVFSKELKETYTNRFRKNNDIPRLLFDCFALANNRGHLQYVTHKESVLIEVCEQDYQKYFQDNNFALFCLNDTENATNEDRKRIVPFLEALFPNKTTFEK